MILLLTEVVVQEEVVPEVAMERRPEETELLTPEAVEVGLQVEHPEELHRSAATVDLVYS